MSEEEIVKLKAKNQILDSDNRILVQKLKDLKKEKQMLKKQIKELEKKDVIDGQMKIENFV